MHLAPTYTRLANAPDTAITLLAANLERGIYRAATTGIPVDSQVLFAWHNAGIVAPPDEPGRAHQVLSRAAHAPYLDAEAWAAAAPRRAGSWLRIIW